MIAITTSNSISVKPQSPTARVLVMVQCRNTRGYWLLLSLKGRAPSTKILSLGYPVRRCEKIKNFRDPLSQVVDSQSCLYRFRRVFSIFSQLLSERGRKSRSAD